MQNDIYERFLQNFVGKLQRCVQTIFYLCGGKDRKMRYPWSFAVLLVTFLMALPAIGQSRLKVTHFGPEKGVKSPGVNCLAEDSDGFIWIGSNMGLTRFDGTHFRTFPVPDDEFGAFAVQPRQMRVEDSTTIRINTRQGQYLFDIPTGCFQRTDILPGSDTLQWSQPIDRQLLDSVDWGHYMGRVRAMMTDREGGIWMGSFYEGLFYLNTAGHNFHHITSSFSHPLVVRPICSCANGEIFVGTENEGLFKIKASKEGDASLQPVNLAWPNTSRPQNIQSLMADGDTLWVATFGQGIGLYHLNGFRPLHYYYAGNTGCGLTKYAVVCLLRSSEGDVYAGTVGGLFVRRHNRERFESVVGTEEGFIHALAQTSDGTIWVGSLNRPLCSINYRNDAIIAVTDSNFTHPCVTSLMADNDGRLWIGTDSKGVWRRESNGTYSITPLTGERLASSANMIVVDQSRRLWVSSFNGLYCYDTAGQTVTRYSQANGLPTDFFSYASATLLPDGQMLMGTHEGLVSFRPDLFRMSDTPLRPFFTNVRIGERDTIAVSPLVLPYDAPSLRIDYAAPTYAHASEAWYRYRVEGVNNDKWTVIQGGEQCIHFSHLPPGRYCIQLQAGMSPVQWEGPVVEMNIVIKPPLWFSTWAYVLYAAVAVVLVLLCWSVWRSKMERRRLQQQIKQLLENRELLLKAPEATPYALIKDIAPGKNTNRFMDAVDAYLERHVMSHELSVDTLAENMNMSVSTLYRHMKSITSLSPNEYIRLFRLKRAAVMLRRDGLSIREVSERLCFSSVGYFTNCFSHQFGITPGEYVKH